LIGKLLPRSFLREIEANSKYLGTLNSVNNIGIAI
jgi:hypothetical protein